MPYLPILQPQPYGPVKVAVPGTPVQLSSALVSTYAIAAAADVIYCNKISILPLSTNAGNIYIGQKNMNKATMQGVIVVLSLAGASGTYTNWQITNNVSMNIYQLQTLYLDADNANDGVYGSIDTV